MMAGPFSREREPPVTAAALSRPPGTTRVAALDGLRGIAVLMVIVMHYYAIVPTADGSVVHSLLKRSVSLFFSGVDLFFVLSGYLIGGILLDHRESPTLIPAFFWRRFLRIIPLYALLLASFFAARAVPSLVTLSGGEYFNSAVPLPSYFVMLQNVAMSWTRSFGNYWLSPTWSLGIEEQFYLLMPFVVRYASRRVLAYGCMVALVVCPLLRLSALLADNSIAAIFLLPMRTDSLLAGVLCAIAMRDSRVVGLVRAHRPLLAALLASFGAFLILLSSQNLTSLAPLIASFGYTIIGLFFAALLLWILVFPVGGTARLLGFRPLRAVGVVSYFVYLFHLPVVFTVHWAVRGMPPWHHDWQGGALTVLALAITLFLAAISWRYLESPLLRVGRRSTY